MTSHVEILNPLCSAASGLPSQSEHQDQEHLLRHNSLHLIIHIRPSAFSAILLSLSLLDLIFYILNSGFPGIQSSQKDK